MQSGIKRLKINIYELLRWSEKYTKTDMVYLASGGSWTSITRVIGIVAGFSLSVAFANLLPQEVFGNYKFIISLASIIGAFSLTGMGNAVIRSVARGYDGTVRFALLENLKWSWGMVVLALSISLYYYINGNVLLSSGLIIIAASLPLINSFNLSTPFLKGRKAFKKNTFYSLPRNLLPPLSLIITLFLTTNPIILVGVYFVSQAIAVVGTYLFTFSLHTLNEKVDYAAITFSKHLSVMNVLEKVSKELDKILLFHFLGAAPLAIYAFATAPIRELRKLNGFFLAPSFPKLSQRTIPELKRSLPYRMGILFLILIPVVGAYVLVAPYVYEILFPQYTESVIYSQVFALSLLFMPIPILTQTLMAHLKRQELYIIKVATPIVRIVAVLILLPLFGIWGAIAALMLTNMTSASIVILLFKRLRT